MQGCKRQAAGGNDSLETSGLAPASQENSNHNAAAEQALPPVASEPMPGQQLPATSPSDVATSNAMTAGSSSYLALNPAAPSTNMIASTGTTQKTAGHHQTQSKHKSPSAAKSSKAVAASSDSTIYKVKSGDTLTKIAKSHGTTVSAIRTTNNLKSDRLVVGQKLKLPSTKLAANTTPANPPGLAN
jgi:LysM repeat protein